MFQSLFITRKNYLLYSLFAVCWERPTRRSCPSTFEWFSLYELSLLSSKYSGFSRTFCDRNLYFTTGSFWAPHHFEIFSFPIFDVTPLAAMTSPTLVKSYLTVRTQQNDVTTSNKGNMSNFVYLKAGWRHSKHSGAFLVISTY